MITKLSTFLSPEEIRKSLQYIEHNYAQYFMVGHVSIFKSWRFYVVSKLNEKYKTEKTLSKVRLLLSGIKYLILFQKNQKINTYLIKIIITWTLFSLFKLYPITKP